MPRCLIALLTVGLLLLTASKGLPVSDDTVRADEGTLKEAGIGTDSAALLELFRKRTLVDAEKTRIVALIRQMGDDEYKVREQATRDLIALGPVALSLLREAVKDADLEIVKRAQFAIESIERGSSPAVLRAAARLLAQRKPADAAEVLLAYLPFAEDSAVSEEVVTSLQAVALRSGKPSPVLVKALEDKMASKRAAAGEALGRAAPEVRPSVRKLLKDSDPMVRLRVGLALAEAKDKEAIPVLIALLTEKPKLDVSQVEDLLYLLAGEKAPAIAAGSDAEGRRKYRAAWEKWWQDSGKAMDLAKFDPAQRMLGYTLICAMDVRGLGGKVFELDRDNKVRWQIDGLNYPIDAQVIGNDRVLIAEYRTRTVTERNFKNEILWSKNLPALVLGARRLPSGNTFIVTRNQMLEVDKDGKDVTTLNRGNDIAAAGKWRDGQIGLVTTSGQFVRFDSSGREVKSFALGSLVLNLGSNIDLLPGGHVLVPLYSLSKVAEFDADGKKVWEASVNLPASVMRLPNGHTLVGSRVGNRITELDRNGKEVWTYTVESGRPMRARRR